MNERATLKLLAVAGRLTVIPATSPDHSTEC